MIEIVTKPIEGAGERAPEVARAYVTALRELVAALGVSDAAGLDRALVIGAVIGGATFGDNL